MVQAIFGGQERGGISTPSRHPVILLFSSKRGLEYGYRDGWHDDGFYHYSGEGQRGPMAMVRGNHAIANHVRAGKPLMVFEKQPDGRQLFLGYMDYVDHYETGLPDVTGSLRPAIIFRLTPITPTRSPVETLPMRQSALAFLSSRPEALEASTPETGFTDAVALREHTAKVARYILERANGFCEACGHPAPFARHDGAPYLEIHSSYRLSDSGPDHPSTLLALCPTCHSRAHHGSDAPSFNRTLAALPKSLEAALDENELLVVTAAVIGDSAGNVYVTQRTDNGMWEFPGGKANQGETLEQCLVREIREELAVDLVNVRPFARVDHRYPGFYLRLFSFLAEAGGMPRLQEHTAGRWIPLRQLDGLPMAPPDRMLAGILAARVRP